MHFPTDRTTHSTVFDGPVVDHWVEWKIAQTANASAVQDRSGDLNLYKWVLYHLSYVLLTLGQRAGDFGSIPNQCAIFLIFIMEMRL